jgi:hypothetical protein
VEIALAFAEYARFSQPNPNIAPIIVPRDSVNNVIQKIPVLQPTEKLAAEQGIRIAKLGPQLIITSSFDHPVMVRLLDVAGHMICAQQVSAFGSLSLKEGSIKSGYHLMQITDNKSLRVVQPLMMMN